jgi:hypothetical protein
MLTIATLFTFIILAADKPVGCLAWSQLPLASKSKSKSKPGDVIVSTDRRHVLQYFFNAALGTVFISGNPAVASNLPASTGADTSKVGTVESLIPIVSFRSSLARLEPKLANREQPIQLDKVVPTNEQEFKRLFDAYSDPVNYKQKFLDQNAFLVYYTKGFDGPGRSNVEEDTNERQTLQFGARNEAWIAWENFLVELKFIDDADNDLAEYLSATKQALDSYLKLAPLEDVKVAQQTLGVSW